MRFEICVDSVTSALASQQAGADRVEVCANLVEGGTTPSFGLIKVLRKELHIQLNVLVRPRGGDFLYCDEDFQVMMEDTACLKAAGCDGIVTGFLTKEGDIDLERTKRLADSARPMSVTFHRAFDMLREPEEALEKLIKMGIDRVLTSGQKPSALEGVDNIQKWVRQADGRIIIMAGAGIDENNLFEIVRRTHVDEVHFSARKEVVSGMKYQNMEVKMGKAYQPEEYLHRIADIDRIRQIIAALEFGEK